MENCYSRANLVEETNSETLSVSQAFTGVLMIEIL